MKYKISEKLSRSFETELGSSLYLAMEFRECGIEKVYEELYEMFNEVLYNEI